MTSDSLAGRAGLLNNLTRIDRRFLFSLLIVTENSRLIPFECYLNWSLGHQAPPKVMLVTLAMIPRVYKDQKKTHKGKNAQLLTNASFPVFAAIRGGIKETC